MNSLTAKDTRQFLAEKKKPSFEFKPRFFHPLLLRHLDRITFWVTYIGVKHMAYLYSGEATYTACEMGQPICNSFSVLCRPHQYRRLHCRHICFSPGLAYDDVTSLSVYGWLFHCSRQNLCCSWCLWIRASLYNSYTNSNEIPQCIKILFHIYMKLVMFRATHRPSSGA